MTETPPSAPYNPKADHKAAKAYAKATRPWYKKKRWILAIVVVVIIVAIAAGGGSSDDSPEKVSGESSTSTDAGAKDSDKKDSGDDKAGTKGNPIKVGETVKLKGTQYTVESAKTSDTIGGEYTEEKAGGIFVVVELTIENKKDETKTFLSNAATFIASNDKSYDTSDDAIFAVDEPLILEEMQPDLPKTGTLVFDVPPKVVAGGLLKVEDLFGDGEAFIDLGLK
jgi:hypothetical protein